MMDTHNQDDQSKLSRISMRSIWNDLIAIFNFEKGVLRTLKGLLIAPSKTIDEYLHVNRSRHAHPMRLLIFSTAISTVILLNFSIDSVFLDQSLTPNKNSIAYNFGKSIGKKSKEQQHENSSFDSIHPMDTTELFIGESTLDTISSEIELDTHDEQRDSVGVLLTPARRDSLMIIFDQIKKSSAKEIIVFSKSNRQLIKQDPVMKKDVENVLSRKLIREFVSKLTSFQDKLIFLLVPLYAFGTFLFFRKKSKFNFAENLVVNAYLISFQNVITIALIPFVLITTYPMVSLIGSLLSIVFTFYFWMDVFKLSGFRGFMKAFLVLCFSYFFYTLITALILRFYLFKDVYESLVG